MEYEVQATVDSWAPSPSLQDDLKSQVRRQEQGYLTQTDSGMQRVILALSILLKKQHIRGYLKGCSNHPEISNKLLLLKIPILPLRRPEEPGEGRSKVIPVRLMAGSGEYVGKVLALPPTLVAPHTKTISLQVVSPMITESLTAIHKSGHSIKAWKITRWRKMSLIISRAQGHELKRGIAEAGGMALP